MTNLIVIVDPDYGDRVERAAQSAPVWIVASKTNRDTCEQLWRCHRHPDHRELGAVTLYETLDSEDRLRSLLSIVPALETHHGEVNDGEFSFPKAFVLEVIGMPLTDSVTNALRELGFTSFVETLRGFHASK